MTAEQASAHQASAHHTDRTQPGPSATGGGKQPRGGPSSYWSSASWHPANWRGASLRRRLTLSYAALLAALLLLTAFAVQQLLQRDLYRTLEEDLGDTYTQFEASVPNLGIRLHQEGSAGLAGARAQFPSSVIQIDPLVLMARSGDLTRQWAEAKKTGAQQEVLDLLRKQMRALRPKPVGIDPAQPLELTDAELTQLIESPRGQVMIRRQVKPQFSAAEPMQILVTLAPLELGTGPLGTPQQVLTVTYVGRSLSNINETLAQLGAILVFLLLTGVAAGFVGTWVVAGQALRPLVRVRQAVDGIGSRNLAERVPVPPTGDEVEALAHAFNEMLERIERSFETQRRFTSDASHELRTPITAIGGHATYLLRRTELSPQQRESIEIIQRESERMTDLIQSLLHLARTDSGVMTLERQPIFPQMFLHELAQELGRMAEQQQVKLITAPHTQDVLFEGDPDRLRQVMNNLISNAIKAGATQVTLGATAPREGWVRLSVSDNGPGIAAAELDKLFGRFYRLEDSRSRDKGGAGLGLSIAQSIVVAHGGQIWLESVEGSGTQAYVELPLGNLPTFDEEDVP